LQVAGLEGWKLKSTRMLKFFLVGVFEAGINPPLAGDKGGGKIP